VVVATLTRSLCQFELHRAGGAAPAEALAGAVVEALLDGVQVDCGERSQITGLSSDDVGFAEAAATLGAQTGLSTFVSYAAFGLILFLKPPSRLFASWSRPDGDRRPAVLAAVLVVAFSAGLYVPWFTGYFGVTDAAEPVFLVVLPTVIVWFLALTAAYRFRLLDRALGLDTLP
jgi:cation-transporting ATPase E